VPPPSAVVWCLLFSLSVPLLGHAQVLPPETVQQINAASRLRVHLRTGSWASLHGAKADSSSFSYRHGEFLNSGGTWVNLPSPLLLKQVDQIQVARGSHAGSGAKIGGGIMAGLTLLAIVGCEGSICEPSSGEALAALVGWTALGSGLGALIGSGSPRWETVYSAQAR
jgi:hypothetical protein